MANEAKRGLDLLIYIGEGPAAKLVGGQREASYEMTADVLDASTKNTGDWKVKVAGAKEWSAECGGVYFLNDEGYKAVKAAFIAGETVMLRFSDVEKTFGEEGKAIITSMAIDVPYDDLMTYSLSFEGAGALTEVVAPA